MEWLNYHHLLYFWTVAREGGLGPASRTLRLARPTLSAQIRALEERLGEPLFLRQGRKLVLTEAGQVVLRYADEIFSLGRELLSAMRGGVTGRLTVGIADAVPKMIVRRLLGPIWSLSGPLRVICLEDTHDRLLTSLAAHELDVVVSDAQVPAGGAVRAYNHLLGECGVTFFGAGEHARLRARFPQSLEGAPVLLPAEGAALRRALDHWLDANGLRPRVVAEFEDSALLKACGQEGVGVFAGPTAVEKEIVRQYGVRIIGRAPEVRERFWLLSPERRLKHPAVVALSDFARHSIFGDARAPRTL
jgi:LysR family transcriptional activator of nhaA